MNLSRDDSSPPKETLQRAPGSLVLQRLPHLPAPVEHDSAAEKRCAGCGTWNHPAETRCQRCGRKLEVLLGASGRREIEETESLPGPTIPAATIPKPSPQPEWKEELNRRLAGYRERQGERSPSPLPPPAKAHPDPGAEAPSLAPPRIQSEGRRLPPLHAQPARPAPREAGQQRLFDPPPIVDPFAKQARTPQPRAQRRAEPSLAPIRRRFIAGLLDLCVVALAVGVFLAVAQLTNPLTLHGPDSLSMIGGAFVVLLVIYWVAYLRLMGSTAGMHWTGLRVVNLDGEPPDTQQRWTRACGTVLSAAALGVGFLWSIFDEQHYTWHDRVSKTFVSLNS